MDPNDAPRRYLKYIIKIEWFFQSNIRQFPPKTHALVPVNLGSEAERSGSLMPACPCLVSVSSRTRECTRDSSGALKPQKPSAQF